MPDESGIFKVIVDAPRVIWPPDDVKVNDSPPPALVSVTLAENTSAMTKPVPGVNVIATSVFTYSFAVTLTPRG